jgi:hypothetical protein
MFRIPGVLGGGVTASTALGGHGKTLSYQLLPLERRRRVPRVAAR